MPIISAVAATILVVSLVLLLVRPRRVPDWAAALGGGLLLVIVGVLLPGDALAQLTGSWNVFLFFLGLGLSAATADPDLGQWATPRGFCSTTLRVPSCSSAPVM